MEKFDLTYTHRYTFRRNRIESDDFVPKNYVYINNEEEFVFIRTLYLVDNTKDTDDSILKKYKDKMLTQVEHRLSFETIRALNSMIDRSMIAPNEHAVLRYTKK